MTPSRPGRKILVLDDEPSIVNILSKYLDRINYVPLGFTNGKEAIDYFERTEDIYLVLSDIDMPDVDGIEILKQIKSVRHDTQVIIISGAGSSNDIVEALRYGACDYLMKPIKLELLHHAVDKCFERYDYIKARDKYEHDLEEQVKEKTEDVFVLFNEAIKSLSKITALRDPYTAGHQSRVTTLSVHIARNMRLSQDVIESIRIAGLLHDIGKISVPTEILVKPAKLTEKEIGLMQEHVNASFNIVKNIPFVKVLDRDVAEIVRQHHERIDGSGYPRQLKGEDILFETKILSICDVVESMSLHRPYRPALGLKRTLEEIRRGCGQQYDDDVCNVAIDMLEPYGDNLLSYFEDKK